MLPIPAAVRVLDWGKRQPLVITTSLSATVGLGWPPLVMVNTTAPGILFPARTPQLAIFAGRWLLLRLLLRLRLPLLL